jgi:long-subunit acyl-CoA synthetase (AMP-forming)
MADVDIVDGETGRSVPRDGATMGEIVLRGGCVTMGYFKDEDATRAAIRDDGWFYTGDVGVTGAEPNGLTLMHRHQGPDFFCLYLRPKKALCITLAH